MTAMILAAGLGTRLRPITDSLPKCLVPIDNDAILGHIITRLKSAGVDAIFVNTHYFSDQISTYLASRDWEIQVQTIFEPKLLETAGAVANAAKFLQGDEPFLVHNADILTDIDLRLLIESHRISHALATLAVKGRNTERPFLVDESMRIVGHRNKKLGTERLYGNSGNVCEYGFCGIEVMSQEFLQFLLTQETKGVSLTEVHLAAIRSGMDIRAYDIHDAAWFDIGDMEKLEKAREWFDSQNSLRNNF